MSQTIKSKILMKQTIYTLFMLLMPVVAHAQVEQLPEKVYVNQESQHKTTIYRREYLQQMGIVHHPSTVLPGRSDSLRFVLADGQPIDYLLRETDSITFYAPDELMRSHLAYHDKNYSKFYPTYSDDYRNNAGWNNRNNWQLANVHDPRS